MAKPDDTIFPNDKKPTPGKEEFRDIKVGKNLVGRVYRSGKVIVGFMCEKDGMDQMRIEVETSLSFKEARQFFEKLTGMINIMEGRY